MSILNCYDKIKKGEMTYESFQKAVESNEAMLLASAVLTERMLADRYTNSNNMAKSYMDEFAKRGLIYVPVNKDDKVYVKTIVGIAHEILATHTTVAVSD